MPAAAASHFAIDLPTLWAVAVFIAASGGLLLIFSWLQDRSTPSLALWGIGYLLGAAGIALLGARGFMADAWSICGAHALLCGAYGVMWGGARAFEGRRIQWPLMLTGAAIWLAACQSSIFYGSLPARVTLASAILATYTLLSAREIWHARDCELISRWPTLALVVVHAIFLLGRIPFAGALQMPPAPGQWQSTVISAMTFEALFVMFCLAFLRVAMAKERAELEQRKAALTDSLTGVANRRAFFDRGARLLERTIADRRSAALLLFDLDRFKEVNDTAGHSGGDRLLQVFSNLVSAAIGPDDLFARIGGEEFACLLPDATMAGALRIAERVRQALARTRFAGLAASPTVSAGVPMASDPTANLPALLATADRALYRAKADGRNRVAPAPLVLVDTSREVMREPEAAPPGRAFALTAPVAR